MTELIVIVRPEGADAGCPAGTRPCPCSLTVLTAAAEVYCDSRGGVVKVTMTGQDGARIECSDGTIAVATCCCR